MSVTILPQQHLEEALFHLYVFFLFSFHSLPFPFSTFFPLFPYICSLFFKTTSEVLSKAVEYINVLIGRGECGHCSRSTFFTLSLGTLGGVWVPP